MKQWYPLYIFLYSHDPFKLGSPNWDHRRKKKQVKIPIVLEGGQHSIMLKYCIQQCSVLSLTKRYRLIKGHRMNGPPTFDGVIIEGARPDAPIMIIISTIFSSSWIPMFMQAWRQCSNTVTAGFGDLGQMLTLNEWQFTQTRWEPGHQWPQ